MSNFNIDWRKSVIILSGGFDPIHKGHMRMFREASNLGHQVIVGLNSDAWLSRKKGKPFMKFYERKEILEGIKYISSVVEFNDSDDSGYYTHSTTTAITKRITCTSRLAQFCNSL